MKKNRSTILAAAVTGLFLGAATTSCSGDNHGHDKSMHEKHSCKGNNGCQGKDGCGGKNGCDGKSGCSGKNGCDGKNSCKGE